MLIIQKPSRYNLLCRRKFSYLWPLAVQYCSTACDCWYIIRHFCLLIIFSKVQQYLHCIISLAYGHFIHQEILASLCLILNVRMLLTDLELCEYIQLFVLSMLVVASYVAETTYWCRHQCREVCNTCVGRSRLLVQQRLYSCLVWLCSLLCTILFVYPKFI